MATSSLEVLEGVTHKFQGRFYCTPCMCKICHQPLLGAGCMCKICRFPVHKTCTRLNPTGCVKISPKDLVKNTVKAGVLQKHSSNRAAKSKGFGFRAVLGKSTRYCILTQDHIIFYFKDINSDAACGAIALTDCSHVEKVQTRGFVLHQEGERDPSGVQVSEGSDYVFTAESPSERDDWVDIIDSFLHLLDRKTLVESITLNSQAQKQEHSQKLRHCRYLEVKLLQAKDLPAMDISGTSDTYWMLKCQDTVHRSETIWKNNKDPRWDETFNFPLPHDVTEESTLVLTAWDKDMWSADDLMAMRSIRFGDVFSIEGTSEWKRGWYDLHPVKYGDLDGGDVYLGICKNTKQQNLIVHVVQCRNLGVTSHSTGYPMVKVLFGKVRKKTEQAKKVVDDPLFDTTFEFALKGGTKEVVVEVWAMHTFTGTCLGRVVIAVDSLPDRRKVEEWHRLSLSAKASGGSHVESATKRQLGALGAPGSLGKVQLELRYTDQAILPTDYYDELLALVLDEKLDLALALAATVKAEKEDVGRALLRAFASEGKSREIHLIRELVRWELQGTLNAGVIFRQNTVVTKAVDAHLRLFGTIYLRNVLGSLVTEINQGKKSFEVDPSKAQKGDDIDKNMRRLHELCAEVLERIFSQLNECPLQMREVFKCILQEVFMKFADDESLAVVKYTCITGFLFLRFFVAALLSPHLYDLLSEPPTKVGERNLKLVGKVLQTLANMKEFGDREPFMKDINTFIVDNQKGLQEYTHSIAVVVPDAPAVAAGDRIFLDFELAILSKTIEHYRTAILDFSKGKPEFCARLIAVQDRLNRSYAELKMDSGCNHENVGTTLTGSLRIPRGKREIPGEETPAGERTTTILRIGEQEVQGERDAGTAGDARGPQRRSGTLVGRRSSHAGAGATDDTPTAASPRNSGTRANRSLSAAPVVTPEVPRKERFAGGRPTGPLPPSPEVLMGRAAAVSDVGPHSPKIPPGGRSRSAARSNLERPLGLSAPKVSSPAAAPHSQGTAPAPAVVGPARAMTMPSKAPQNKGTAPNTGTQTLRPAALAGKAPHNKVTAPPQAKEEPVRVALPSNVATSKSSMAPQATVQKKEATVAAGRRRDASTNRSVGELDELEALAASASKEAKPRRSEDAASDASPLVVAGVRKEPARQVQQEPRQMRLAPAQSIGRLERSPGLGPKRTAPPPQQLSRAASAQAVFRSEPGRGQPMRGRGRGQSHIRRGSGGTPQRGRGGVRGRGAPEDRQRPLASSVDPSKRRIENMVARSTENVFAAAGMTGPPKRGGAGGAGGARKPPSTDSPSKLRFVQRSHRTDVVVND